MAKTMYSDHHGTSYAFFICIENVIIVFTRLVRSSMVVAVYRKINKRKLYWVLVFFWKRIVKITKNRRTLKCGGRDVEMKFDFVSFLTQRTQYLKAR